MWLGLDLGLTILDKYRWTLYYCSILGPNELNMELKSVYSVMFYVQMNDIETAQIREHFYDTSHWINDAFNQNEAKVLVTCWQGASRWVREIWRRKNILEHTDRETISSGPQPWRWPICLDAGVWAWPRPSLGSGSIETSGPTTALYHNS